MIHLLFEQSGTFKNQFKKMGFAAEDYDILDDFGETDHIIDLFKEIDQAYKGGPSIFDKMTKADLAMAFFPCVRFEDQIQMAFRGTAAQMKKWTDIQKLEYDLKLHEELHELYSLVTKLAVVCLRKGIPLIIENPYSTTHYLVKYWSIPYTLLDVDRRASGDYYKKPTQYWFINCKPTYNFVFESTACYSKRKVSDCKKVDRSMISPDYANRFIREYILTKEELEHVSI